MFGEKAYKNNHISVIPVKTGIQEDYLCGIRFIDQKADKETVEGVGKGR